MKVQAGQKVWIVDANYRGQKSEPKEVTVLSVGRKYFTIDDHFKTQFLIENGIEKSEGNYKSMAYESLNEILEEKEYGQLRDKMRGVFAGFGRLNLSLDQLRKINEIITNQPTNR